MITARDIRNRRFEKAAFGYKQEEIDEFLAYLEDELTVMEREFGDSNHKIQVLADKVREYMKDEDALKDALFGAQKQGKRVIAEANEKAENILADANEKAAALIEEANREFLEVSERNRAAIEREKDSLITVQQQVTDFKKSLFEMYKSHLEVISSMPDSFGEVEVEAVDEAEEDAEAVAIAVGSSSESYESRRIKNAYDSRFGEK